VSRNSKSQFYIRKNSALKKEDFPNLPDYLVGYFELFEALLSENPYSPESLLDGDFEAETGIRFYSHDLDPPLSEHRALNIVYLRQHYRVVYKIDDRPQAMKVDVYSFDRHDPAYDKAKNRSLGWK
jgi:mRNA interferase RelE/StbE